MTRKSKPPVAIYSALADVTRCRIIEILRDGPIPVHRLADAFSISRPAISRHLRVLKTAGLVAEVKKGRENLYEFKGLKLAKSVAWIESMTLRTASGEPDPVPQPEPAPRPEPVVVAPEPEPSPQARPIEVPVFMEEKTAKIDRVKKPDPINQMGFDF